MEDRRSTCATNRSSFRALRIPGLQLKPVYSYKIRDAGSLFAIKLILHWLPRLALRLRLHSAEFNAPQEFTVRPLFEALLYPCVVTSSSPRRFSKLCLAGALSAPPGPFYSTVGSISF